MAKKKESSDNARAESGSGKKHDKHGEKAEGIKHDKHAPTDAETTSESATD